MLCDAALSVGGSGTDWEIHVRTQQCLIVLCTIVCDSLYIAAVQFPHKNLMPTLECPSF